MSFGRTQGEAAANTAQAGALPALGAGVNNLQSSANFFQTLLNGNQANTMAAIQPDINRIRESTQGSLQGASTLMPRGGGRFATLFQQPFQVQKQTGDLFSGLRSGAAGGLANIGGTQAQIGSENANNLFQSQMQHDQQKMGFLTNLMNDVFGMARPKATP